MKSPRLWVWFCLSFSLPFLQAAAYESYSNVFVNPDLILVGEYNSQTRAAQQSIIAWADELNAQSPWSVTKKPVVAPSGNKHDYMSWAPYWWPDCSKVGNTSVLPPQVVWTTCPYVNRDGQFNPDISLITDNWSFQNLSDAVFYDALVWAFQKNRGSTVYSRSAAQFLKTWFIDPDTMMNPNLNYAQVIRGPRKSTGTHTGVLDLKCFAKIASAILIFRKGNAADWTPDLDSKMVSWVNQYIGWLETANLALQESEALNNHGTFYYNQLAALKLIAYDIPGAKNVTETYFNKQYQGQIDANGTQPFEIIRTRPYHYTAYNLGAMITNANIATYVGNSSIWTLPTRSGATIKTALDFALTLKASATNETPWINELTPSVGTVAVVYGDLQDKYAKQLDELEPTWKAEGWVLWTQPLSSTSNSTRPANSKSNNGDKRLTTNTLLVVGSSLAWLALLS
ncbi:hypothetical protein APHAL10511_007342 [Amanita phalloides]|nr:hypothetical protein APHAL10511_007342 [Amanita phalloides]